MQDSNRTFFDDFALRIKFMREKRGLGLAELSGGAASTAKSWEAGSRPRPALWDEVAGRLGLSVSFVFLGKPVANSDYDFIAKFADEIEGASTWLAGQGSEHSDGILREDPAPYGDTAMLKAQILSKVQQAMEAAGDDRVKLSWLLSQVNEHVRPQAHWSGVPVTLDPMDVRARKKLDELKARAAAMDAGTPLPFQSQAQAQGRRSS